MLSRRELIAAGMAGGVAVPAHAAETRDGQEADREGQREIARRIVDVDRTLTQALLTNTLGFGAAGRLREQMQQFFRSNLKFPDFIDVGMSVFMELYDWHVRNQQQLLVQRGPDGRYWMQFMFTTLVLRGEVEPGHIGIPYDKA